MKELVVEDELSSCSKTIIQANPFSVHVKSYGES